jgi:hypothetical protein
MMVEGMDIDSMTADRKTQNSLHIVNDVLFISKI